MRATMRHFGSLKKGNTKTSFTTWPASYEQCDLIIGMDRENLEDMRHICLGDPEDKIHLLMDYTDRLTITLARFMALNPKLIILRYLLFRRSFRF